MLSESYVARIARITDEPENVVRKILHGIIVSLSLDAIQGNAPVSTPFGVVTTNQDGVMTIELSPELMAADPESIFDILSKRV